jgi:acetolactate synthase-1/2/3 large subunit
LPDVLDDLIKLIESSKQRPEAKAIQAWWAQIELWKTKDCLRYDRNSKIIKPQFVVEKLYEITKGDAIVTSDVGQHQMWAAQYYHFSRPRQWINSGGLGTMGFAVPAAMGAKTGQPDKRVVAIDGDGCFQMTAQELATSNTEKIPFVTAILNNGYLGMVRQWQELFFEERYSGVYLDPDVPDYVKLAEAYGAVGLRVDSPGEVDAAIEKAYAVEDRSVVIDFRVDPREGVFPMVPAGASNDDIILGPEFAPHEIPGEAPIV